MDVEKLIKLGGQLSLQGEDLRVWVDAQIKEDTERKERERHAAREDREREAELREKDREREAKLREKEAELREKDREREAELREKEAEIREREAERKEREMELQAMLVERQLELERIKQRDPIVLPMSSTSTGGVVKSHPAKSPRLPPFSDTKDDNIDSYLLRFERYATVNGWERSEWSLHLSALLTGKALDVYSRLDMEQASNYDVLKEALLNRYNLTEEGFNNKFRASRPEANERMGEFRSRVYSYLEKWIEMAGMRVTDPQEILDLFLKEHLLSVCGKELRTFLKERKPKTSKELVELTENFVDAHGVSGAFIKQHGNNLTTERGVANTFVSNKPKIPAAPSRIVCHKCSKPGHIARDCRSTQFPIPKRQVFAMKTETGCTYCHRRGHEVSRCWERARAERQKEEHSKKCVAHESMELKCGCALPVVSAACLQDEHESPRMPVATGWVNGKRVTVLRDSGCSCVVVKKGLLPPTKGNGKKVLVHLANGATVSTPLTEIELDSPYYKGKVVAAEMDTPLYDVIVGNIPGARCPGIDVNEEVSAVETRGTKGRKLKPLLTPSALDIDVTMKDLITKQMDDPTLGQCRRLAESGEIKRTGRSNKTWYGYDDHGILVRYFECDTYNNGDVSKQVVVPSDLRHTVMKVAHETILAGHLAAKKTTDRILHDFFWPNVWAEVSRFCLSCDQCQRSMPKGKTPKVPLTKVPLIDEPFQRVAVDLVGPMIPASDKGNKYILTVVDYCTRYPEAIPLKTIDTETVAEALVDIYSRVGIPREVLSDRGAQFTSELMREVCRLLSMKQLMTTPYHPQCNGLVERFNATLKGMLKRLANERPKDWDRYINAALFAYREAPQESLGFSPFELLYARPVRGPMTILRELWTNDIRDEEIKTTYQYVIDLREKMERMIGLAQENLKSSSARYKAYFDSKCKKRTFQTNDKVLLLLPTKHNKLEVKWQGPFNVVKRSGENNYVVDTGTSQKTYHANLLKKYHERDVPEQVAGILQCAVAAVVNEEEDGGCKDTVEPPLVLPNLTQKESYTDTCVSDSLNKNQREQLQGLLSEFSDVLTDVPGRTNIASYELKLTSDVPIRKKPYPVPQAMKETLREEVKAMLDAGIIEPSDSPYCSPSVVVKKKDGTNRYCVDYRALNNVTVFDAEPMPRLDDLFQQIGPECRYMSRLDLSKGYWQISLTEESKPKTAFATELGLMQFTVLPFGLQCAPAAFSRLMRKVLWGLTNVRSYIDDILIHHADWKEHMRGIESVLSRLREAGLTARPTKSLLGFPQVEFLGHQIGSGTISPLPDKVQAIKDAKPPQNKKQMRSFLGLASFYRRYIPNFSAIVSPLSDATRNGMPNRIVWQEPQQRAFEFVKKVLTSEPVLRLPDFDMPFVLTTDASDTGIGAILAQEYENEKFPVMYLSRKLLPREQRYSVIERECLALVWATQKLNTYLIGREFMIETDHAPLLYLNRAKSENGRLMRWALLLSQYRFTIRAVKGSENHGADFLSRLL